MLSAFLQGDCRSPHGSTEAKERVLKGIRVYDFLTNVIIGKRNQES